MCMWVGPVNVCLPVCSVHICTCVFACEIECKLVVSCRPQCRLMPYRQVIYDLSVAGREKGDTRLSLQINKRCSGAHITSPLHVCKRTDLAPALYLFFCVLKQLSVFWWSSHLALFSSFLSFSTYFNTFFLCAPLLIPCTLLPFSTLFLSHLWLSLFCPLSQQGAGDFDMPAIIYRNMV